MAGLKGKSGPPGNMNAFKHGLAAIQKRREEERHHRARGRRQAADSRAIAEYPKRPLFPVLLRKLLPMFIAG